LANRADGDTFRRRLFFIFPHRKNRNKSIAMTNNKQFLFESRISSITDGGGSTVTSTAPDEDGNSATLFFVTSYSNFEKLGE
jgi:hypothetical protein